MAGRATSSRRPRSDAPLSAISVLYRNKRGADTAAIVTALGPSEGDVHLFQFPAPGDAADIIDYRWGCPRHEGDGEPLVGTWRPRPEES